MSNLEALNVTPFKFIVGARELEFIPLTMKDLGSFEHFVRFYEWSALKDLGGIDNEELAKIRLSCLKKKTTPEDWDNVATGFDGLLEMVYLSARHKQPDLTRDWLGENLKPAQLNEISNMISAAINSGNEDPVKEDEKKVE